MSIVPQNLFQAAGAKQSSAQRSKNLVEFKAGKMYRDSNNVVRPDNRKGLIYLKRSSEDSLLHFCWQDRKSSETEDDLIIFPDDAQWIRITQCTTGRAYVLKFKSSSQRLFFWLQESNTDKDEETGKKINDIINGSPEGSSAIDDDQEMEDSAIESEQNQLLQLLASQGITFPTNAADGAAESSTDQVDLASTLTPELLLPVIRDESLRQRLFPFLPENHGQSEEELQSLIRSPQFSQAVQSLDAAIRSGQFGPLIAELGLDPAVATVEGDRVLALLRALKDKAARQG